ncbi:hypothetical protein CsSME_00032664 [Camellia sinensis var. sinensis]
MTQRVCELLWIKLLLSDLGIDQTDFMRLYCDNKAAINIAHNPVQHDRTKRVEIDRHFIKEKLTSGTICTLFSYGSAASVPKFGAWDERDPKSGEGFTVIFDKVKQEKHIAAAKVPTMPPPPSNYMNSQKKNTRSKVCIHVFEFHPIMIYKHYDYIA